MRALLCLFLTLFTFATSAAQIYPPASVKVRAVKIAPHSYYIPGLAGAASTRNEGFMSNAGFVNTPAGDVVFDTLGSPSLAHDLRMPSVESTRAGGAPAGCSGQWAARFSARALPWGRPRLAWLA